ncbi:MAG: pyridoxamine 5'-phosphate oxidase family protein, partial [Myxococcales bacterium]|nr:pyridoxamine 5'-phosphate oxidase family protein [Myxococcales bacterium]
MPSRRSAIAMSDAERRAFLSSAATLIVVSNGRNGVPHPMPMWFCVDADDCLYCTTFARSQKVRNFERDSRAALLVESGTAYGE